MRNPNLILDTCALLWLASGSDKISEKTLKQISSAEIVFISAISGWEISLKVAQGKLELPKEPKAWFETAIKSHNLFLTPLNMEILFEANKLPWHHRDPADRFIISTAIRENATVVTANKKFKLYNIDLII
jgi:PIN domain nuclease of toxin-antitoxin system